MHLRMRRFGEHLGESLLQRGQVEGLGSQEEAVRLLARRVGLWMSSRQVCVVEQMWSRWTCVLLLQEALGRALHVRRVEGDGSGVGSWLTLVIREVRCPPLVSDCMSCLFRSTLDHLCMDRFTCDGVLVADVHRVAARSRLVCFISPDDDLLCEVVQVLLHLSRPRELGWRQRGL